MVFFLKILYFHPYLGEMIQFDSYFVENNIIGVLQLEISYITAMETGKFHQTHCGYIQLAFPRLANLGEGGS